MLWQCSQRRQHQHHLLREKKKCFQAPLTMIQGNRGRDPVPCYRVCVIWTTSLPRKARAHPSNVHCMLTDERDDPGRAGSNTTFRHLCERYKVGQKPWKRKTGGVLHADCQKKKKRIKTDSVVMNSGLRRWINENWDFSKVAFHLSNGENMTATPKTTAMYTVWFFHPSVNEQVNLSSSHPIRRDTICLLLEGKHI